MPKITYIVKSGDNFYTIAQDLFGSQRFAGMLIDANPGTNALRPGMEITIPDISASGATVYFSPQAQKRSEAIDDFWDQFKTDPDFPNDMFDDPLLNTPNRQKDILNSVFNEEEYFRDLNNLLNWDPSKQLKAPTLNPTSGLLAPDLTDEQVIAQIVAVGGNPDMPLTQAREIIHNARQKKVVVGPTEEEREEIYKNKLLKLIEEEDLLNEIFDMQEYIDNTFEDPLYNTPEGLGVELLFGETVEEILSKTPEEIDSILRKIGEEELIGTDFTEEIYQNPSKREKGLLDFPVGPPEVLAFWALKDFFDEHDFTQKEIDAPDFPVGPPEVLAFWALKDLFEEHEEATERFFEIIKDTNNTTLENFITLFEDNELNSLLGVNGSEMAKWVMSLTRNGIMDSGIGPLHFKFEELKGDEGFKEELRDQNFYRVDWEAPDDTLSPQIGHFLTAVDMYKYGERGIRFSLGHEKIGDTFNFKYDGPFVSLWKRFNQYAPTSSEDIENFHTAIEMHKAGNIEERDQLLWQILGFDDTIELDETYVDSSRQGNSLQDLRLTLMGYVFAEWLVNNPNATPIDVANWLRDNLQEED